MSQVKQHKEPLLRIAKRDTISHPKAWGIRIVAVLLSLVVSGLFIFAVTKLNPVQVYEAIFDGAFGRASIAIVGIAVVAFFSTLTGAVATNDRPRVRFGIRRLGIGRF